MTEQEPTPRLGKIALDEIDRRAAGAHTPTLLVRGALQVSSATARFAKRVDVRYRRCMTRASAG